MGLVKLRSSFTSNYKKHRLGVKPSPQKHSNWLGGGGSTTVTFTLSLRIEYVLLCHGNKEPKKLLRIIWCDSSTLIRYLTVGIPQIAVLFSGGKGEQERTGTHDLLIEGQDTMNNAHLKVSFLVAYRR